MLLTRPVPYHVVVSQGSPAWGNLGGAAEGGGVEVAQNFEGQLRRKGSEEIDSDEFTDASGNEGKLGEAALSEDALQHQFALLGGSGREK